MVTKEEIKRSRSGDEVTRPDDGPPPCPCAAGEHASAPSRESGASGSGEGVSQLLLEQLPQAAAVLAGEGTVLQCNEPFSTLVGKDPAELRTQPLRRFVHRDALPAWDALVQGASAGRIEGEVALAGPRGPVPVLLGMAPLGGQCVLVLDLTQRCQYEQLQARQAELLAADRRKDEFLAMLAHELRNPLAPIRNSLEIVRLRGKERRKDLRLAWEVIGRQVEHLTRLVEDLLDVSRIARGKMRLRLEPVDLASVVARAVETSRPLIEARRHTLEVSLPSASALRVRGDRTRLAQVLLNLLNNAAKYTAEGGRISVAVETTPAGQAVIRVRDTGVGIPPEMLPRIFDLFTQLDATLESAEGGLGVGLMLVRTLVELHGGAVEAFSPGRGQGSEFVVSLPLLADADALAGTSPAPGRQSARRILVVNDNKDAAEGMALVLRHAGHTTLTALDAPAALAAARALQPELVLCDLGLPGVSGYELARQLKAEPRLAGARLVALGGYGSEEDRQQSRAAGFDHHLVLPVDLDALRRLVADGGSTRL